MCWSGEVRFRYEGGEGLHFVRFCRIDCVAGVSGG